MKELIRKAKELAVQIKSFVDSREDGAALTEDEAKQLETWDTQLKEYKRLIDAGKDAGEVIDFADAPAGGGVKHVSPSDAHGVKRLSDLLPGWDEYKGFTGISGTIDTKTIFDGTAADDAVPDYGPMALMPKETLLVRSIFGSGSTGTDTAKYLKQTLRTNAADFVTATGAYPESAFEFTWQTDTLAKVGHSLPVSDDTLADRGQMASILDGEMTYGVAYKIDRALIMADGSGEDPEGLLHRTGVQVFDKNDTGFELGETDPVNAAEKVTLFDIARRLIEKATQGSAVGFVPDFIGLTPQLATAMDLSKDGVGRYLEYNRDGRVWRLPVVESPAFYDDVAGEHHIVVGPGKLGAQVLTRRATNVEVGYVNDQFVKDCKTIKASERFIFKVPYPVAFADWSITDADLGVAVTS